jgi:hypothetical protein
MSGDGLLGRVAVANSLLDEDVGHAEVVELALALLEEEHELVPAAIVIPHADGDLVPDQGLPETKSGGLRLRDRHAHRFRIAEEVEVAVLREHSVEFREQLVKPAIGEDVEPLVARGLCSS